MTNTANITANAKAIETATAFTTDLLAEITYALGLSANPNSMAIRESVEIRKGIRESVERLTATKEFQIFYGITEYRQEISPIVTNDFGYGEFESDFLVTRMKKIWFTLHALGQGQNDLDLKVTARDLESEILAWQPYREFLDLEWLATI
jgi:hypothetical protein